MLIRVYIAADLWYFSKIYRLCVATPSKILR